MQNLTVHRRLPDIQEFKNLRIAAEWPIPSDQQIQTALSNSLFGVVVFDHLNKLVGMGRIIGDLGIYLHIQDVIVRPDVQKTGIGSMIMKELMEFVHSVGRNETHVGLMSSKAREGFYKKFGFTERPSEKFGAGMTMIIREENHQAATRLPA
jgi:GNAT superfamily N-acetyltransferase